MAEFATRSSANAIRGELQTLEDSGHLYTSAA